jgi:hypothetical protein
MKGEAAVLGQKAPEELGRVETRMMQIYNEKAEKYGVDAANDLPVEAYFRLAGGVLNAPKPGPGKATRKAKAQKKGAVRAQQNPDQIGRVRSPKGKSKKKKDPAAQAFEQSITTKRQINDFFFGES